MKITKDMTIGEVVRLNPETARVLTSFGMGCISCPASQMESLEDGAMVHGIDLQEMLDELNKLFE